ncbi:MAG: hypothetical protein QOJ11_273 [Frankiales bacterium]|jgi:hypothetical protein|nr:hypothetical protein [Frankiales bacterium]
MTDDLGVMTGGHRRIDRLLGEEHDLATLGMDDLRQLRADAEQEETDASYVRRLLQGRIDIVEAERAGRRGESSGDLVSNLARILTADEGTPSGPRGLGRHSTLEPSRADEHRRHVEALVADVDLSDVSARTDGELESAVAAYREEEHRISTVRKQLQALMDACSAEVTRRYRQGEVDVSSILPTDRTLD